MKLGGKLLAFLGLFFKFPRQIHLIFRRIRSELRSLKRQIPDLQKHGWPKFIVVASKADADACAAPMVYLLAKGLKVDQVWWRHVRAGEEYTPRGLEHFIPMIHFDTSFKFDGEIVDGKVVKPGKRYFDHHQPGFPSNHCATSLVVESFKLKDPVLSFLGEYVRLVDTGNPGAASGLLSQYSQTRLSAAFSSIITLHKFFETAGTPAMSSAVINEAGISIGILRVTLLSLKNYQYYTEYFKYLLECEVFWKALCASEWDKVTATILSAEAAAKAIIAKFIDPDPSADRELYLAVYGINKNNAGILQSFSPTVANLDEEISRSEQLWFGAVKVKTFYNAETRRRKIIREVLPGGAFKPLEVMTPTGTTVRIITAENCLHPGNKMRVNIRQTFNEMFDLIISDLPNGSIGLNVVNQKRGEAMILRRFFDELVARHPVYAPTFLANDEFSLYLKTIKKAKAEDKLSFAEVVALAREIIESPPKAELPVVSGAELPPIAEVRPSHAPKALAVEAEATI